MYFPRKSLIVFTITLPLVEYRLLFKHFCGTPYIKTASHKGILNGVYAHM